MKYAKKMKLVECKDSDNTTPSKKFDVLDAVYVQPKTLQNLDSAMSEILFNKDLSDNKKWTLYNQILHRYLHFTKQYNPQYTSTVKTPPDYSRYLDGMQLCSVSQSNDTEIRDSHNATQSSINTTNIAPQQNLSNISLHSLNEVPSFNTAFNNSLPSTSNVTMQSIKDHDMSTPVRQFFNAARSSSANELQFPTMSKNIHDIELLPNPTVRLRDIGPVARNTRAKRRAYHLDNTIPSPIARKSRKLKSIIRTTNQDGGLLKNWIRTHLT